MSQIATNDPNYFQKPYYVGDFNDISQDASGFGLLPAAEQNQTYFVYSDGIASAEPEFIGQTLYNIKYLIDENGSVYKPNSDQTALFNLKNNFTRQDMVVETQTATQILSNLLGEQKVNDIGSLQPLIFSENGTAKNDYEPTMSFTLINSPIIQTFDLNDITFTANGNPPPDGTTLVEAFEDVIIYYKGDNQFASSEFFTFAPEITFGNAQTQFDTSSGIYTFNLQNGAITTADYGTDVSFNFQMDVENISLANYPFPFIPSPVLITIYIQISSDGGSNWTNLPLINNSRYAGTYQNGIFTPGPSFGSISNTNAFTAVMENINDPNTPSQFYQNPINISTVAQNFNNSTQIRIQMRARFTETIYQSFNAGRQFLQINSSQFRATTNYSADLYAYAPYFVGATYPTDPTLPQYITASIGLSNFMNQTPSYIYYPSQSLLNETNDGYGFNKPALPFNPQIGDYIRFEYDKNKQSRIYNVFSLSDGRKVFQIHPSVPTGSQLNHFVITRIVNDGGSILSPSRKLANGSFSSFIKPKYVSQILTDNFPTIINNLEKDGLLTS